MRLQTKNVWIGLVKKHRNFENLGPPIPTLPRPFTLNAPFLWRQKIVQHRFFMNPPLNRLFTFKNETVCILRNTVIPFIFWSVSLAMHRRRPPGAVPFSIRQKRTSESSKARVTPPPPCLTSQQENQFIVAKEKPSSERSPSARDLVLL